MCSSSAVLRAAGAQLLQLVPERDDALVHALVGVLLDVFEHEYSGGRRATLSS